MDQRTPKELEFQVSGQKKLLGIITKKLWLPRIPGSVPGWAGGGLEHPGMVESVPAMAGDGTGGSFPTQVIPPLRDKQAIKVDLRKVWNC